MYIPVSFGTLRLKAGDCILEHRNTSNHLVRTPLVKAKPDDSVGTTAEVAFYLTEELGLSDGSMVFVDGFFVGDDDAIELAVRSATGPPSHIGMLQYSGARSLLVRSFGSRLLRRCGDPILATEMLRNCGKRHGERVEIHGTETLSAGGVPSIEIDSVEGC